jgi:hypothetical protein
MVEDSIGRGLIFEVEKGFWESRPIPHRISLHGRIDSHGTTFPPKKDRQDL